MKRKRSSKRKRNMWRIMKRKSCSTIEKRRSYNWMRNCGRKTRAKKNYGWKRKNGRNCHRKSWKKRLYRLEY